MEVLVKEVDGGLVSKQLKHLQPGAKAEMDGPFGFFTLGTEQRAGSKLVFIASGTGISPFHCMVGSYPALDYTLIHGVRTCEEAYDREAYDPGRYVLCTSRDTSGHVEGRVTDYLARSTPVPDATYYLCGNAAMIDDVYEVLVNQGVEPDTIRAEVYF